MDITEKAAALKKLAQNFTPDLESPEARLLTAMLELLGELTQKVADLQEDLERLNDQVDDMDEDLDEISAALFEDEEGCCGDAFELECPNCGITIQVDEGTVEEGSITCPGCEEILEFEFGCDCGCAGDCGTNCDCGAERDGSDDPF
jgi:hypothetical protein